MDSQLEHQGKHAYIESSWSELIKYCKTLFGRVVLSMGYAEGRLMSVASSGMAIHSMVDHSQYLLFQRTVLDSYPEKNGAHHRVRR